MYNRRDVWRSDGEMKKVLKKIFHIYVYINFTIFSSKNQALDIKTLYLICVKIEKH